MQHDVKSKPQKILGAILNACILAGLIALLVFGHRRQWKLPQMPASWRLAAEADSRRPQAHPTLPPPARSASPPPAAWLSTDLPESLSADAYAGIELARVELRPLTQEITAYGVVAYDQTRVAQLASRVSGTVWSVQKRVGQAVRKGEILAIIEALDVGRKKTDFLKAVVDAELKAETLERMRNAPSAIPEQQVREADANAREARIVLLNAQQALVNLGLPVRLTDVAGLQEEELVRHVRFLGLPESLYKTFDPAATTANLLPLTAPFDGVITEREMVTGELVSPASGAQLVMADVSRMWVELEVHKGDAGKLRRGQEVVFTIDEVAGEMRGELSWISTEVNHRTHNVLARMEVENPLAYRGDSRRDGQRLLRANMFGVAKIQVRENPDALVVPNSAVRQNGADSVVFVKTSAAAFEPRVVELGTTNGRYTEVLAGVSAGDMVAAAGSRILQTANRKVWLATDRY